MKKLLVAMLAMIMVEVANAAYSDEGNRAIETYGYSDDAKTEIMSGYSAYYCKLDTAKAHFGNKTTIAEITTYLQNNFASSMSGFIKDEGVTTMRAASYTSDARNTVLSSSSYSSIESDTTYLALMTYDAGSDGNYFRVFTAHQGGWDDLVFTGAAEAQAIEELGGEYGFATVCGSEAGSWTLAASVPEPTSGLLLLLGMAGLALKRKRV